MNKWLWLALAALLVGSIGMMFWVTGIGDEPEPLFESIDYAGEAIPELDPRKLTVWAYGGEEERQHWQEEIDTFQEAIGEEVNLVLFKNAENYSRVLEKAQAEQKLPDLMLVSARQARPMAQAGLLAPLALPEALAGEWVPPAVQALAYPGQAGSISAYPSDFAVLVLYYNKRMFDAKGMAYPDDHWSWPILSGIAKAQFIKGADGKPVQYGVELPLSLEFWNALSVEYGAPVYAEGKWLARDLKKGAPQAKALGFLLEFFYTYVVAPPPAMENTGQYFLREASAMAVAGPELLPTLMAGSIPWGATIIPKEDTHASPLRVEGWAVLAKSAKAQGAAELALLFASESKRMGWLPARVSSQVEDERLQAFYQQVETAVPPPVLALPPQADQKVFEVMKAAIESGDIDGLSVVQKIGARLFPEEAAAPAEPSSSPTENNSP